MLNKSQIEQCHRAWTRFTVIARPTAAWLSLHKAGVVITLLTLYILWPKNIPPRETESNATTQAVNSTNRRADASSPPPTTGPAPTSQQYAGDVPLFLNDDPKWSLPVELRGSTLQSFATEIDRLYKQILETESVEETYSRTLAKLAYAENVDHFWTNLREHGFKDQKLPQDWYNVVKDYDSVFNQLGFDVDLGTNMVVQNLLTSRLGGIKIHVIGGQVLVGDQLFVKACALYIDGKHTQYTRLAAHTKELDDRVAAEFPSNTN